jgi:hypothetical protein
MCGIAYNQESSAIYFVASVDNNMLAALSCMQHKSHKDTASKYYERFNSAVEVVEHMGGTSIVPGIKMFVAAKLEYNDDCAAWLPAEAATVMANAKELYLAAILLKNADPGRYGDLQIDTKDDFTRGSDTYPRKRVCVIETLNRYENKKSRYYQVPRKRWYLSQQCRRRRNQSEQCGSYHEPQLQSQWALCQ